MENSKSIRIAQIALLSALTIVVQTAGFPQPITGPLINALLYITASVLGIWAGLGLGLITPLFALIRGQLPAILAPMLPFICIGNMILVLFFTLILKTVKNRNASQLMAGQIIAIILASSFKFIWLTISARYMVPLLIGHPFPKPFLIAMSFPQLLTALAGGALFLIMQRVIHFEVKK